MAEEDELKCLKCGTTGHDGEGGDLQEWTLECCRELKYGIFCRACYEEKEAEELKTRSFKCRAMLEMGEWGPLAAGAHSIHANKRCCSDARVKEDWEDMDYDFDQGGDSEAVAVAVAMIKEGKGDSLTSEDRSIIMKAFAAFKKTDAEEAAKAFAFIKPFLSSSKARAAHRAIPKGPKAAAKPKSAGGK